MAKKSVVCVVTSEKTWKDAFKYCFNDAFRINRHHFDLAVVFNGSDNEGISNIQKMQPEHMLIRPNKGLDLAAYDYAIKILPYYDQYILLHDDHWFHNDNWFLTVTSIFNSSDYDIMCNLVPSTEHIPINYTIISTVLGYEEYPIDKFPFFAQGLAGWYKRRAIDTLLKLDGIPHTHNNNREAACVCERIHSFLLYAHGMKFAQIPPGYEKYLRHRDW